jgi:adenylate cyclase
MRCPACQADNRADRRFCADRGAALAVRCSACEFVNQPGEKFCGGCGAALERALGSSL